MRTRSLCWDEAFRADDNHEPSLCSVGRHWAGEIGCLNP